MAKSVPVSVRLDENTFQAARELARRSSRSLGSIVGELAEEAIRMRQHPGIVFSGPPGDRQARVEGSGLEVWEVISAYRRCDENPEQTLRVLTHLSRWQLEAALRYFRAHRDEVGRLIEESERSVDEWRRLYPHIGMIKR